MLIDPTDDEAAALLALMDRAIAIDRFSLSPRSGRCKAFGRRS